jgi:hypothetical protein
MVAFLALALATPAAADPTIAPSPNPGTSNTLGGLVAFSATDIWGVGTASSPSYSGCHGRTLRIHSSGGAFTEVSEASPTPICASVNGAAGLAADDIWAVGSINSARDPHVRHWDGTRWTAGSGAPIQVPPSGGRRLRTTALNAVTVVPGSGEVWAVGKAEYSDFSRSTLAERFTNNSWKLVTSPTISGSVFNAVSPLGWAVGSAGGGTLAAQWTGSAWSQKPTPNANTLNALKGVSGVAAADVWAVGSSIKSTTDGVSQYRTLAEHWNGSAWTIIPTPNHGTDSNELTGVAALGARNVWAVGYRLQTVAGIPVAKTLVLHWDGNTWTEVPSPSAGTGDNLLAGAVTAGPSDVWAYGNSADGTLVMHVAP